jgi:Tfp pilus assembly protein PilO
MRAERPFWRRFLLPVAVVLATVNLLALVVWTGPRSLRQSQAAARAEKARSQLVRQRQLVAQLRERRDAMRANAADRERLYSLAGTEQAELAPTHEAVQAMARGVGLQPGDRAVSHEDIDGTPFERVSFRMPLSGSYPQLVGFLREVERAPRFIVVDRISMQGEPGSAKLQVELSTIMKSPSTQGGGRRTRAR